MNDLIDTFYRVITPSDSPLMRLCVRWPREPGYDLVRAVVEPHLGGEPLEHIAVLHNGARRDMFVSELGTIALTTRPPLPRNERATAIYRAAWLARHPECDPESLAWIAGPAVLFERRVWF
jgi:hypothetical protein